MNVQLPLRSRRVTQPLVAFVLSLLAGAAAAQTIIRPEPTDEVFANPGMGWQTFHRFADEDKNLQGLPSASAYFRFYWRELEPAEGQIDFAKLDSLLSRVRKAGQQLAFRVMITGSGEYMDVPKWLKELGCKGTEFSYGGRNHWVPDSTDPHFQRAQGRLIRELGAKYNGHPDLDLVDIGSVGLWGEWHMSSTKALDTGKPVPLPSVEERHAIIDAWCQAFPNQSKAVLVGSMEGMTRAAREGLGWRADCLGDMGGFSKTWNHMDNFYLQQLEKTGAQEAWKTGPVAFESCWDMRKWKQESWDIRYIYDYALRCHVSYMNNKSAPLPEGARPEVERFLRRIGYRLVLRQLEHPAAIKLKDPLPLRLDWENVGVAPPYRDYRLAVRLRTAETKSETVLVTTNSIRGWLPGTRRTDVELRLPNLAVTQYELAIGVVAPGTQTPAVRLAISGRDAAGWHPVSRVEIRP